MADKDPSKETKIEKTEAMKEKNSPIPTAFTDLRRLKSFLRVNKSTRKFITYGIGAIMSLGSGLLVYREYKSLRKRIVAVPDLASMEHRPGGRGESEGLFASMQDEEEMNPTLKNTFLGKGSITDIAQIFVPFHLGRETPQNLLKMANSKDLRTRNHAVDVLAKKHNWKDDDFKMLAANIDHRVLVGLAHSIGADKRFFPPMKVKHSEKTVEEQLVGLVSSLSSNEANQCTKYFASMCLQAHNSKEETQQEQIWNFDGNDMINVSEGPLQDKEKRVQLFALEALIGYSKVPENRRTLVRRGILDALARLHEKIEGCCKRNRLICKVLANLSIQEELVQEIVKSGWLSKVHEWLDSEDLDLQLLAVKTAFNLDIDQRHKGYYYEDGIEVYAPYFRTNKNTEADIVFIHGLLGGPTRTWRQRDMIYTAADLLEMKKPPPGYKVNVKAEEKKKDTTVKTLYEISGSPLDKIVNAVNTAGTNLANKVNENISHVRDKSQTLRQDAKATVVDLLKLKTYKKDTICWPKDWLALDMEDVRLVTVEYDSYFSEWSPSCPYNTKERTLDKRGKELLKKLLHAGIGDKPVVWIGHSMGGLLIKQILSEAAKEPDLYKKVVGGTKGIIMYGTPHFGSPLAKMTDSTRYLLFPSVEVTELRQGSQVLLGLHEKFKKMMQKEKIPFLCFGEGQKSELPYNMPKFMVVPQASSNPGFGKYITMKDCDHLQVCKPENQHSFIYQTTLNFIKQCLECKIKKTFFCHQPEDFVKFGNFTVEWGSDT